MSTVTTQPKLRIEPCTDAEELRAYIDEYWRRGHILARDPRMFDFQYRTPWVDRAIFPEGISVLCVRREDDPKLLGFLGSIVAPYPRPQSYWLALWHVLPELKGTGMGGRLLSNMQQIALESDGWIGTFGAGPEALPVYLKRGYAVRAVRRWQFAPDDTLHNTHERISPPAQGEAGPPAGWIDYRFAKHPLFTYEIVGENMFRVERNEWGRVVHACRLGDRAEQAVAEIHQREQRAAERDGCSLLLDAWSFTSPGPGWMLAPDDLPSVFHPPEARGNVIYAVGRPFVPSHVQKGDCDQDRPN